MAAWRLDCAHYRQACTSLLRGPCGFVGQISFPSARPSTDPLTWCSDIPQVLAFVIGGHHHLLATHGLLGAMSPYGMGCTRSTVPVQGFLIRIRGNGGRVKGSGVWQIEGDGRE